MELFKAKAHLANDIFQKFAPIMDNSESTFSKMTKVCDDFNLLDKDFYNSLTEDNKIYFLRFLESFTDYISDNTKNQKEIVEFYSYIKNTAETLIDDYKRAANG